MRNPEIARFPALFAETDSHPAPKTGVVRFVVWVAAFTIGAAVSATAEGSPRAVACACALPVAVALFFARRRHALLAEALLACSIGSYVGARAAARVSPAAALAAVVDGDRPAALEALVTVAPEAVASGARLRVAIERVDGLPVRANGAVSVAHGVPDLLPGDVVRFVARVRSPRGLANPGVADSALQARVNGTDCLLAVARASDLVRVTDRDGSITFFSLTRFWLLPFRWAARARKALDRAIDAATPAGDARALLHTAVLGERRETDARVEDGFRAAGATHVLSVSGLHLAAVAFVFFLVVRRAFTALPRVPLWIEPRRLAALLALPAIGFYTMVSGDAIATVRSAVMMAIGLLGVAFGRRMTPLVAVAAAVAVLMAWSPLVLFDVSFQLSVTSVLALGLLASRLAPGGVAALSVPARMLRGVGRLGAATVAAGATTAPLVAHHFGEVTPAAPLGNLLLVPLVEMVVVPFGLGGAALAASLGAGCGRPFLGIASAGARLALAIAERFRRAAPVWTTRAPNVLETASLVVGIALALAAMPRRASGRRWKAAGAVAALILGVSSLVVRDVLRRRDPSLVVTFLDVGQGDAAVIEAPGGWTMLIDGGGSYDGSFDPGARVVEPFLRARGITRIDVVALSHPHPDHLEGLHRVLARFPVGELWTSGDDGRNPSYRRLIETARERGVRLPVPSSRRNGGLVIEPLGPFVNEGSVERVGPPEGTTVNDASLVLRAAFGGRSLLFAGDLEADGEGELVGRKGEGQVVAYDVLKVPHHGSRTSSSAELLDAVRPRLAVMSLGWKNRFNFPSPEVLGRYRARQVRVLRTDRDGAVTVRVTPQGELVTTCARDCP